MCSSDLCKQALPVLGVLHTRFRTSYQPTSGDDDNDDGGVWACLGDVHRGEFGKCYISGLRLDVTLK